MSRTLVILGFMLALASTGNAAKPAPAPVKDTPVTYKDPADLFKKMKLTNATQVSGLGTPIGDTYVRIANESSTVFVPSDAAYAKYLAAHFTTLRDFAPTAAKSLGASVLTKTPYMEADFKLGSTNFTNVFGDTITLTKTKVTVKKVTTYKLTVVGPFGTPATVITSDLVVGPSRFFIIDTVLEFASTRLKSVRPPQEGPNNTTIYSSVSDALKGIPNISFMGQAVAQIHYAELVDSTPMTLFAPTDAVFDALAVSMGLPNRTALLTALPLETLTQIMAESASFGPGLKTSALTDGQMLTMESLKTVTIHKANGTVTVSTPAGEVAHIIQADIMAGASIIQIIDRVLLPTTK